MTIYQQGIIFLFYFLPQVFRQAVNVDEKRKNVVWVLHIQTGQISSSPQSSKQGFFSGFSWLIFNIQRDDTDLDHDRRHRIILLALTKARAFSPSEDNELFHQPEAEAPRANRQRYRNPADALLVVSPVVNSQHIFHQCKNQSSFCSGVIHQHNSLESLNRLASADLLPGSCQQIPSRTD